MDAAQAGATRTAYYAPSANQGHPSEFYAFAASASPEVSGGAPSPRTSLDDASRRPRRTSGASSFAESIASSHASSNHSSAVRSAASMQTSMSEGGSMNPRLRPSGSSEGFLVDVPGVGAFEVPWSELVGLFATPGSVESLPDKHIVKRTAFYTRSIIKGPPPAMDPHQSFIHPLQNSQWAPSHESDVNAVAANFSKVSMQHPFAPQPMRISRRHTDSFAQPPLSPLPVPLGPHGYHTAGEFHGAASTATLRGDQHPRDLAAEYRTPLERAFTTSHSGPPISASEFNQRLRHQASFDPSASFDAYPADSAGYHAAAHLAPAIQAQNLDFVERHARPHPGVAPAPHPRQSQHPPREHHQRRVSQAPYSRTPSLHSHSSSTSTSSTHESEPGNPRAPRALNSKEEHYMWNSSSAQLFRVQVGIEVDSDKGEIITFPPGTYYKVVKDDMELPSDGRLINEWLRSQHCVGDCRFRFEKKRPATIRAHFMGCKSRQKLLRDPIKRLCELQTQAQRRFKNNNIPMDHPGSAWGDHHSETSSLSEADETDGAESLHSSYNDQYYDHSSSYGSFDMVQDPHQEPMYETVSGEQYQPIHALASPMEEDSNTSKFAHALVASGSSSMGPETSGIAANAWNDHPWLAGYGLADPSNGAPADANGSALPDEPLIATGSFLSMGED